MNELIKNALPWLGTALGGPLGGMAASFVGEKLGLSNATVDTVKSVLSGMSPEKLAELKQHDEEFQLKLATLGYTDLEKLAELAVRVDESTGATMRAEATAEHWPTYSWRPYLGAVGGTTILWNYGIGPMFHYTPVVIPDQVWLFLTAVLGVASFFRGKAQADPNVQTTVVTSKG